MNSANESNDSLAIRERVLRAAAPLFARGETPSISEIVAAAGVSRTTFYRAFASREELLRALAIEPGPETRTRLLEAALDLLSRDGLAALSMDEVADQAGVSRATLYRLFPGKQALFVELVQEYSPFERIAETIEQSFNDPAEEVMRRVALHFATLYRQRQGVFRTLAFELTGMRATTEATAAFAVAERALASLIRYLQGQMELGRLRRTDPVLALQAFLGALFMHVTTRPLTEERFGMRMPLEETLITLVALWLKGMQP
jgi:AcrR family transcriptional regulator